MEKFSLKEITRPCEDKLDLRKRAKTLAEMLPSLAPGSIVAVFGDWGQGKTSFLRMVESSLSAMDSAWIDLWRYERLQEWEYSFQRDLYQDFNRGTDELKQKTGAVASKGLAAFSTLLRSLEISLPGLPVAFKCVDSACEMKETENAIDKDYMFYRNDSEKLLEKLDSKLCCGKEKIIFIDDMDRVEPEAALELLEGIKLLLNTTTCRFVLALDSRGIMEAVRARYVSRRFSIADELASEYLDKIIDIAITLPDMTVTQADKFLEKLKGEHKDYLEDLTDEERYLLLLGSPLNPRALKRFLAARRYAINVDNVSDADKGVYTKRMILQFFHEKLWRFAVRNPSLFKKLEKPVAALPDSVDRCANMRGRGSDFVRKNDADDKKNNEELKKMVAYLLRERPYLFPFLRCKPHLDIQRQPQGDSQ